MLVLPGCHQHHRPRPLSVSCDMHNPCRHPAIEAAAQLDLAYDLGLTPDQLKEHCAQAVRKCMQQSKEQHPQAIVLVRVSNKASAHNAVLGGCCQQCALHEPDRLLNGASKVLMAEQ